MTDLIYREDAERRIDEALSHVFTEAAGIGKKMLEDVESAGIICCGKCKFWFSYDRESGICECPRWDDEIGEYRMRTEEWHEDYCSHAERRES